MKGLLFTYALTYGGAVISIFNPWIGLLIYVCFATIRPPSLWFWSVPPGPYSRIVAIALLAGWALNGFGKWNFGRARAVVGFLIAFWVWGAVAAIFAMNTEVAWGFVEEKSKIFLPFLVGMTLIDSVEKLKQMAWVIVLSQGYVAYDLNRAYYDGFNRLQEIGFGGMDNNSAAIAMVTTSGVAFFMGLQETKWSRKLLCLLAAALMVHCCMFAMSRGAMLGLCVMGAVSTYFVLKQPRHWWALVLAMIVAFSLAGREVTERFVSAFADESERDVSAQSRVEMWSQCIEVIIDSPIVGCGPDNWPLMAATWGWGHGKEAHTLWLQVGAEMGIPGLFFLLLFYASSCWGLWLMWETQRRNPSVDSWLVAAGPMIVSSIVGFGVAAQFVSLEGLEVPYYINLIGAGALKLASLPVPQFVPCPLTETVTQQIVTDPYPGSNPSQA